jgi:hypothetical protein
LATEVLCRCCRGLKKKLPHHHHHAISDPRRGYRGGMTEPAAGTRRVRKRCLGEVDENGVRAEEAKAARHAGGARRGDGRGCNSCRGRSGETAAAYGEAKLSVGANEGPGGRIVTGGVAAMAESPRGRKRHVPSQDSASVDSCNGRAILAAEAAAFKRCTVRHTNTALQSCSPGHSCEIWSRRWTCSSVGHLSNEPLASPGSGRR